MLFISIMSKTFNTFNKFQNNFLIIKYTFIFDKYEHNLQTLMNINIIEYVFIDERIAQLICETFQIIFVFLSRSKFVNEFDDRKIKFIIYVIYFTFIVQNHSKITIFMFIIKIEIYSLILNKF